jgi:hypothetical protein
MVSQADDYAGSMVLKRAKSDPYGCDHFTPGGFVLDDRHRRVLERFYDLIAFQADDNDNVPETCCDDHVKALPDDCSIAERKERFRPPHPL